MSRYWECSGCRALLTRERLESTSGVCPYCDARVGPPSEFADPDAYASEVGGRRFGPISIPPSAPGKIATSFRLLFEQLPLLAGLVLMIKLPSNTAVELIADRQGRADDPFASLPMKVVVDLFFGPISAAAIITVLAERMEGRSCSFREAARAGVDAWGRLFAARLVAGFYILISCFGFLIPELPVPLRLLLLIPGLVLAVRYCLVDEVAVLEQTPILENRMRSSELVSGRALRIVSAGILAFLIIGLVSVYAGETLSRAGLIRVPLVRAAADCALDVFAVFYSILLFQFYWEARSDPLVPAPPVPSVEDDPL